MFMVFSHWDYIAMFNAFVYILRSDKMLIETPILTYFYVDVFKIFMYSLIYLQGRHLILEHVKPWILPI